MIAQLDVAGKRRNNTCRKECNTYDRTAAQCYSFAHHTDWSRWFAISSPQSICCPRFSLMGGIAKNNKQLNFDMKNIFAGSHAEHHWRCSKFYAQWDTIPYERETLSIQPLGPNLYHQPMKSNHFAMHCFFYKH